MGQHQILFWLWCTSQMSWEGEGGREICYNMWFPPPPPPVLNSLALCLPYWSNFCVSPIFLYFCFKVIPGDYMQEIPSACLPKKIHRKVVNKFRQKLEWYLWICSFYHSSLSVVFQFLLMFIAVFITFSLFNKKRNQCSLLEIWSLLFLVTRIGFLVWVWSKH